MSLKMCFQPLIRIECHLQSTECHLQSTECHLQSTECHLQSTECHLQSTESHFCRRISCAPSKNRPRSQSRAARIAMKEDAADDFPASE